MTSKPKGYMFDTNIFDRVMDDKIDLSRLLVDIQLYVTHIQRDEIENCDDLARRQALLTLFNELPSTTLPTESTVLGVSRLDFCKLGDGHLFKKLRKDDPNDTEDALIAETCLENNITLVTEDKKLIKRMRDNGSSVIGLDRFLNS